MDKKLIISTIKLTKCDILYFKSIGINRSRFVRQAIQAHKKGLLIYKYIDEGDEE